MIYESLQQAVEALEKLEKSRAAYTHALGLLELDAASTAPSESWEGRSITIGVLSEAMYNLISDEKNAAMLACLQEHAQELDAVTRRKAEVIAKEYNQLNRIPADEYIAYTVLLNDAQAVWEKAKNADDFSLFQPSLEGT